MLFRERKEKKPGRKQPESCTMHASPLGGKGAGGSEMMGKKKGFSFWLGGNPNGKGENSNYLKSTREI